MTNEDPIGHADAGGGGEFYIESDGERIAELTYTYSGDAAVVAHTWVHPQHRGGNLAPRLVEALVEWAREGQRQVIPVCSYARTVFSRTPAYGDVWRR